jgi:hypothetical protein
MPVPSLFSPFPACFPSLHFDPCSASPRVQPLSAFSVFTPLEPVLSSILVQRFASFISSQYPVYFTARSDSFFSAQFVRLPRRVVCRLSCQVSSLPSQPVVQSALSWTLSRSLPSACLSILLSSSVPVCRQFQLLLSCSFVVSASSVILLSLILAGSCLALLRSWCLSIRFVHPRLLLHVHPLLLDSSLRPQLSILPARHSPSVRTC